MKTIGIIGGMSWASTAIYYQRLCEMTRDRVGGLTSPKLLISSLNFAPIAAAQADGDWEGLGETLNSEARRLEAAGADILLLATNTMHKCADAMLDGVKANFIHIADATGQAIAAGGLARPGLMA